MDTEAIHHETPDFASLSHFEEYHGPNQLHMGNGKDFPIQHTGSTSINSLSHPFYLHNIFHVPQITKPLISVQKSAQDNNVFFEFHPTSFSVKDQETRKTILYAQTTNGLYCLDNPPSTHLMESATPQTWHHRLGHLNNQTMHRIFNS